MASENVDTQTDRQTRFMFYKYRLYIMAQVKLTKYGEIFLFLHSFVRKSARDDACQVLRRGD